MTNDDELTIEQLAAELDLSERTIFRYLAEGDVFPHAHKKTHKLTSEWRIPRRDVEAYKKKVRAQSSGKDG
jgi:transcriptional antiterminator